MTCASIRRPPAAPNDAIDPGVITASCRCQCRPRGRM